MSLLIVVYTLSNQQLKSRIKAAMTQVSTIQELKVLRRITLT